MARHHHAKASLSTGLRDCHPALAGAFRIISSPVDPISPQGVLTPNGHGFIGRAMINAATFVNRRRRTSAVWADVCF